MGRWTKPEVKLAEFIIKAYKNGTLGVDPKTNLVEYLSEMLDCYPTRLYDKFASAGFGQHRVFLPLEDTPENRSRITYVLGTIASLEKTWRSTLSIQRRLEMEIESKEQERNIRRRTEIIDPVEHDVIQETRRQLHQYLVLVPCFDVYRAILVLGMFKISWSDVTGYAKCPRTWGLFCTKYLYFSCEEATGYLRRISLVYNALKPFEDCHGALGADIALLVLKALVPTNIPTTCILEELTGRNEFTSLDSVLSNTGICDAYILMLKGWVWSLSTLGYFSSSSSCIT
jgi:hypothetical protein